MKYFRFILLNLSLFTSLQLAAQDFTVRFIGNAAFEISDGEKTLLTDFLYQSGAFGYMKYDFDLVQPVGKVLCLISHDHKDHFEGSLVKPGWHLLAPPGIGTPPGTERVSWSEHIRWQDISVTPVQTPHTPEHHSFLVEWLDLRFYFTGDTETTDFLPKEKVDVLFITPWLVEKALKNRVPLNARQIVVYHHRKNQKVNCTRCTVPAQGQVLVFP